MDRRSFIKSAIALAMAQLSAANASPLHLAPTFTDTEPTESNRLTKAPDQESNLECQTIIKVWGIGGAGCNAINHMIQEGVQGVEFIAANTDPQALNHSNARIKLPLGKSQLSPGARPEAGRAAAEAHRKEIRAYLADAHMVFITAGMGGSTGTGAAPVVAEIAREMGILTIGIVTRPFSFEGEQRRKSAETGIAGLSKYVDSLIVIQNDKLVDVMGKDVSVDDCFMAADDVLKSVVKGIADIITFTSIVGVDLEDVRTVMGDMGHSMVGSAEATGVGRARIAAEQAIASPLLEGINLSGARGVLVNITAASRNLRMKEINQVMNSVKTFAPDDAHIIFGGVYDEQMGDALRVTVVATGVGSKHQSSAFVQTKMENVSVIERLRQAGVDPIQLPKFLRTRIG